jgi:hypothetical protein
MAGVQEIKPQPCAYQRSMDHVNHNIRHHMGAWMCSDSLPVWGGSDPGSIHSSSRDASDGVNMPLAACNMSAGLLCHVQTRTE